MIRALQRKFVIIAMASMLLIVVAIVGAINGFYRQQITNTADTVLRIIAENDGVFPEYAFEGSMLSDEALELLATISDSNNILITPETRYETRYFSAFLDDQTGQLDIYTDYVAAISAEEAYLYANEILDSGKTSGYHHSYRFLVTEDEAGKRVVFLDRRSQLRNLSNLLSTSCIIGLASLIAMFILVYSLSRSSIQPAIKSMEKQKRFITDASHEIKTPLAIISADTEVIELNNGENEWTTSIRNQITRLNGLVKDLLSLTRMEEQEVQQSFTFFSLSEAVRETVDSFISMAETNETKLQIDITANISLHGDEAAIRKLVNILMDNAIKYTPSGGNINVALERKKGRNAILTVANSCDNLPKGDLNQLFDRFYRSDASRSRASGGYGIGLSIAKAITTAHKGKIDAKAVGNSQIVFTVIL